MDETTSSEKSPQIKLTLPTSEPSQSPSSGTKSPTQNQKQQLLPQPTTTSIVNAKIKCDISLETGSATGNPRNKCALKPGHSLIDWVRLGSSNYDLAGTKGIIRPISYEELAKHDKVDDAWLAIRGKVYNVTKYMDFHPGGIDELMKGAGKDATKIFDDVHAWVNYEQLLVKCYVGPLRSTLTINLDVSGNTSRTKSINQLASSTTPNGCFKAPFLPLFKPPTRTFDSLSASLTDESFNDIIPRFDWIQKTNELSIVFYTKAMCNPGIIIRNLSGTQSKYEINIQIRQTMHVCNFQLADHVEYPPINIKINNETGKIECIFRKCVPALWTNFGLLTRKQEEDLSNYTYLYDVIARAQITHDSYALVLKPKQSIVHVLPIGYHVSVTANIEGTKITRSYTPVPKTYAPNSCNNETDPNFYFYLLIKAYVNGALSRYITNNLPLVTDLELSYAKGSLKLYQLKRYKRIGILVAGSGLTPIIQIIDYLMERRTNKIEMVNLLYFNKTENDIWCRDNLDSLAKANNRFQLRYILSEPKQNDWNGETGRISADIATSLFKSDSKYYSEFCLVCGPLPFNDLCETLLHQAGFDEQKIHFFRG